MVHTYMGFIGGVRLGAKKEGFCFIGLWHIPYRVHSTIQYGTIVLI